MRLLMERGPHGEMRGPPPPRRDRQRDNDEDEDEDEDEDDEDEADDARLSRASSNGELESLRDEVASLREELAELSGLVRRLANEQK